MGSAFANQPSPKTGRKQTRNYANDSLPEMTESLRLSKRAEQLGFEQWVDFLLENYSKPPLRAVKTHAANLRVAKHLNDAFRSRKLAELTAEEIEWYLRKRLRDRVRIKTVAGFIERQELKPATVHQELGCFGAC
jgi:hypothetical protein